MEKGKPRLSRLIAILTQLQSKRISTASELAKKHRVSVRTIYRDLRTLEQSGIPIVTEEGKGYTIMDGYILQPVMFTQEEANALITAEQLIKKNRDQSLVNYYESAITKIKATLRGSQKEKMELVSDRIQIRNNLENLKTSNYLIQLQSAIVLFQNVEIEYFSQKKEYSKEN
ncbi:helix-turn-helix transcriptional regulator [Aquimarina agarivorans]|uniref:helix-turn-helix transcriptional regulator n=1 Tax=Aquimarina agarivorans TaxID=980584 RepID=UPI000248EA48|nr:HTH domain-containing protein [Aquimarina agarivorans]